ncbi:MAG: hypothetical protein HC903_20590 [Methylacidiphilales bacterium]|nr:hypothetical protein [Candidatus Methylacidiphilales bacterium]NJR14262.1 hypothetical protein [Calothrix sp. CSU_2_0]
MRKKAASTAENKSKTKLGDKIRNIADRLKQETEVQIKATSRILGAAAQISENHDKLINEVVEMVEEDLEKQNQTYQQDIYTVEILKQKFKKLREAKEHFQLKATSWESLVNKLNNLFPQKLIPDNNPLSNQILESNDRKEIQCDKRSLMPRAYRTNIQKLKVYLEADVAEIFPNSQAVNEALRFLIRVTKENH